MLKGDGQERREFTASCCFLNNKRKTTALYKIMQEIEELLHCPLANK